MFEQQVLVLNSGSSSVKYQLIRFPDEVTLLKGHVDGIGDKNGWHHIETAEGNGFRQESYTLTVTDHDVAFREVFRAVTAFLDGDLSLIDVIGHRIVHGGRHFTDPADVTEQLIAELEAQVYLAPQHMPNNLLGMQICEQLCPNVRQIAVFDTAFHRSLPEHVYRYPVPESWYQDYAIRRYGFHGTSHQFVSEQLAEYLQCSLQDLNLISLHLGNGASVCAIKQGQSIDISMGFTPLEGLMMGSRSGDVDPAIPLLVQRLSGQTIEEVEQQLNFSSGLRGIAEDHDMVNLLERRAKGDKQAELALSMYIYRIRKYVGAYFAVLGRVDAIIFTGGIGEHAVEIRQQICENMSVMGLQIDSMKNQHKQKAAITALHTDDSVTQVFVVKTNEELQIAREVLKKLEKKGIE